MTLQRFSAAVSVVLLVAPPAFAELPELGSIVYTQPSQSPDNNASIGGQHPAQYLQQQLGAGGANVTSAPTTSAANIILIHEYLGKLRPAIQNEINQLNNNLVQFDSKIETTAAMQAALSGLFQPYNVGKVNITAAVGGYRSHQAIAVGAGYRFNENVAAKIGVATRPGHGATYHGAVNFEW